MVQFSISPFSTRMSRSYRQWSSLLQAKGMCRDGGDGADTLGGAVRQGGEGGGQRLLAAGRAGSGSSLRQQQWCRGAALLLSKGIRGIGRWRASPCSAVSATNSRT